MKMEAMDILYCGIAGGSISYATTGRPAYGFGQGITYGAVTYTAERLFGPQGFYISAALITISLLGQLGQHALRRNPNIGGEDP